MDEGTREARKEAMAPRLPHASIDRFSLEALEGRYLLSAGPVTAPLPELSIQSAIQVPVVSSTQPSALFHQSEPAARDLDAPPVQGLDEAGGVAGGYSPLLALQALQGSYSNVDHLNSSGLMPPPIEAGHLASCNVPSLVDHDSSVAFLIDAPITPGNTFLEFGALSTTSQGSQLQHAASLARPSTTIEVSNEIYRSEPQTTFGVVPSLTTRNEDVVQAAGMSQSPLVARATPPANIQSSGFQSQSSQSSTAPSLSAAAQLSSTSGAVLSNNWLHRGGTTTESASTSRAAISLGESLVVKDSVLNATAISQWASQSPATLVTWLIDHVGIVTSASLLNVPSSAANVLASAPAVGNVASVTTNSATKFLQSLGPTATLPMQVVYRFANFNPTATFIDAMSAFAAESASVARPVASSEELSRTASRPWIITSVVLAVDAALAAKWYLGRCSAKFKTLRPTPGSSQAEPLPIGL